MTLYFFQTDSTTSISNTRSILNLRANYYEISNAKMLALKVTNFTLEILNITLYIAAIESIPIGLIGSSRKATTLHGR